jgi:DNA-binding transcriptional regulator YhcF (GntR family)
MGKNITNIFQVLTIDEQSITPKYQQVTNAIFNAIRMGHIGENYLLPSISDLSFELEISRDTAEKAYRNLKRLGIINSVPGKGYFVSAQKIDTMKRVLLMFNKLSQHKKIIYDSFASTLGEQGTIDFYIYNNDYNLFNKILQGKLEDYTHYVIIPHFNDNNISPEEVLNSLSGKNLILLDKDLEDVKGDVGAVYEDFEKDIYNALEEALLRLSKYHTLKIIFPAYTYFPKEILRGFINFCVNFAFSYKVVEDLSKEKIGPGEVFINLMEDDLVILLEKIKALSLKPGKDIGIISYNETPMKPFILNGISTISTNFTEMGRVAAQMICDGKMDKVKIDFKLTLRPSL